MENDELFNILQKKVILILRFATKYDGVWTHPKYNRKYLYNWARVVTKEIDEYKSMQESQINYYINYKISMIMEWVETNYKNKEWEKARNAKNYQKRRDETNTMTNKKASKIRSIKTKDKYYKKVEDGYKKCIDAKIKPTIAKIVEITGVSKNTVNKHLKIIRLNAYIKE